MRWWSTVDTLRQLSYFLGIGTAVLGILTAVVGVRLDRLQRPRSLTLKQRQSLVSSLRGKGPAKLRMLRANDIESTDFADQLNAALIEAGLAVEGSTMLVTSAARGLFVLVPSEGDPPPGASELVVALRTAGFTVAAEKNDNFANGGVCLFVGAKPE